MQSRGQAKSRHQAELHSGRRRLPNAAPDNRQRGFSLLEALCVAAFALILSALAVPQIQRTLQLYRLNTATATVLGKLSEARMNAIKRNQTVFLTVNRTARTVQVQYTSGGTTTSVGAALTLPGQVSFADTSATSITYNSLGQLTTTARTLTINGEKSGDTKTITISATGRVTVS
jgi:Tfp pilus assembly protein FimT